MTSNTELYQKMAEVVEAVEDVDGVRVDDANIAERMEKSGGNPMAAMLGLGGEPDTQQVIALVVEPAENPEVDQPGFDDPPDPEDSVEIEIGDEEAETEPEP